MGAQPALSSDQGNLSHLELIRTGPLDHQRIPRPNRRKHAPTRGRKTKASKGPQNLARKLTLHSSGIRRGADHPLHDTFELVAHVSEVGSILPQVSAEVTKTCS